MSHLIKIFTIIFFLLLQMTNYSQVRLNQMERSPVKWDIPVAKKKQGTLSGWTQQYMQLPDLMDSLNIQDITTDIRYYVSSGDTLGIYYVNEALDTTVMLYPDPCVTVTPGINQGTLEVILNQGSQTNGSTVSTTNVGVNTSTPIFTLDVIGVDGIRIPIGSDAQRPQSPQAGLIRLNTTTGRFEGYNGVKWVNLSF